MLAVLQLQLGIGTLISLLCQNVPRQGCCPLEKATRFNERDGKATLLWGVGFTSAAHSAAAVLLVHT